MIVRKVNLLLAKELTAVATKTTMTIMKRPFRSISTILYVQVIGARVDGKVCSGLDCLTLETSCTIPLSLGRGTTRYVAFWASYPYNDKMVSIKIRKRSKRAERR